ncbi:hypothetical protein AJ79_02961 [Helicocarpus griseus UAMH5409]|uniref:Uncharacterized protein n=1 Tax=Helicocarpus griseus UAMH5409 TaxID=1447875 RepID=A0A2B7XZI1_9EURO|nr:hypothetical protein AJ79_02961 [Helicocarpus griseus UAMH5409]
MAESFSVCKRLIDWGVDVNEQLGTPDYGNALVAAVKNKHMVEMLISSGANVNTQQSAGLFGSALEAAAWVADKETVKSLIDSDADVNAYLSIGDGSGLVAAICADDNSDRTEIVDLLIKAQIANWGSALAAAASRGSVELVQKRLDAGADVNAPMRVGVGRALAAAAVPVLVNYKTKDMVCQVLNLLIKSGADANAKLVGRWGSALAAATDAGNVEAVQLLLDAGANPQMGGTKEIAQMPVRM